MAVIAALLVLNLTKVEVEQTVAAEQVATEGEPYVVKYLPFGSNEVWRVWSDGQVDRWLVNACGFNFFDLHAIGVDHPFPVADAHLSSGFSIVQEFADGRVDHVAGPDPEDRCTIAGPGSDPFCLGDVDRDGFTDTTDLLTLLADWGECVGK